MIARAVVVLLIAGLLAFQVVRTAAVRLSPGVPNLWPGHPHLQLDRIMAEIGARAARGQALPPLLLRRVEEIARKMPLAPEPFLINGAVAQLAGRDERAERLYLEARARDPRSNAARYFLAERYLRTERTEQALSEMGALSRLTVGAGVFAPALAEYARRPGAVSQLRRFFQASPEFEPAVLSSLAADADNVGLILALWSGRPASGGPGSKAPEWQARILSALVAKGDFGRASLAWRRFAGIEQSHNGLFNPQFQDLGAPAPFNWTFGSAGGLAQPAPGGRLEVIYFGRDDTALAQQLLLLAPGRYRLGMDVKGDLQQASEIGWSLDCQPQNQPQNQPLMKLPLGQHGGPARLEASFTVPPGCPAQLLKLSGLPGEFRKTTEFTVGNLQLTRLPGA